VAGMHTDYLPGVPRLSLLNRALHGSATVSTKS
jgi:hypothetical protein